MSLPLTVNTVYAPGAPVKSADLNAIQGCIVGGKHGPITLHIPVDWGERPTVVDKDQSAGFVELTTPGATATSTRIGLPVQLGQRILAIRVFVQAAGGAASDIQAGLTKSTVTVGSAGHAPVVAIAAVPSTAVATVQIIPVTPGAPIVVALHEHFAVSILMANTAGLKHVLAIELDVDKP